jgi:hypothetical protein
MNEKQFEIEAIALYEGLTGNNWKDASVEEQWLYIDKARLNYYQDQKTEKAVNNFYSGNERENLELFNDYICDDTESVEAAFDPTGIGYPGDFGDS